MIKLDPTLTEGIEILNTFFQTKKIHYVLVGAIVPLILIELKDTEGKGFGMRETKDLDYIIKVEDWQEYKKIKNEL